MKKFQFRLEPYLSYKNFLEKQAMLETAKARNEVLECEKVIESSQDDMRKTARMLEKETTDGISAEKYSVFVNYISYVESFIKTQKARRENLIASLQEKQKKLAEKSKDKKIIENFKSRQQEEYYFELSREEQKENDDAIVMRHSQQKEKVM